MCSQVCVRARTLLACSRTDMQECVRLPNPKHCMRFTIQRLMIGLAAEGPHLSEQTVTMQSIPNCLVSSSLDDEDRWCRSSLTTEMKETH